MAASKRSKPPAPRRALEWPLVAAGGAGALFLALAALPGGAAWAWWAENGGLLAALFLSASGLSALLAGVAFLLWRAFRAAVRQAAPPAPDKCAACGRWLNEQDFPYCSYAYCVAYWQGDGDETAAHQHLPPLP